jgi:hypothetical protein
MEIAICVGGFYGQCNSTRKLPALTHLLEFSPPRPIIPIMIHENLSQSIENLSSRMIAIRDSL